MAQNITLKDKVTGEILYPITTLGNVYDSSGTSIEEKIANYDTLATSILNTLRNSSVASTSTSGLMSAEDKTKLNGIENGAQAHIAPSSTEVKNALNVGNTISDLTQSTKFLREDGTWAVPSYTANDGDTLYYLTLNGAAKGTANTTDLGTIYAPTTAGTSGYYLKSNGSGAPTWQEFPTIPTDTNLLTNTAGFITGYTEQYTGTVTGITVGTGGTNYTPTNGVVTIPAYPTTLPASDVSSWAKASTKPSYSYSEISGTPTIPTDTNLLTNGAGFISSVPTDYKKSYASVISVSANTANVTCPSTLGDGDECTVLYVNSGSTDDYSVTVTTDYVTPDGELLDLTCPKGGYCEVNYLKVGSTIYVRGV